MDAEDRQLTIEYYNAKSVIRPSKPSLFNWGTIYLNPYQGCYHDCVYCDGKAENYYMHEDFATRIKVKQNAPQLLETYLTKKEQLLPVRRKHLTQQRLLWDQKKTQKSPLILCLGGGVCDVYQPAEEEVKITRNLLQIAYEFQLPVWILTKSALVLRDLDLLNKINEQENASVYFTITLADDAEQLLFEPNASPSSERFDAIRRLRKENITSGIFFYPILPFIGDRPKNVETLFQKAKEINASCVQVCGLTLKPGKNKREFFQTLKTHYPTILPKYQRLYGNNDKYGILDLKQAKILQLSPPEQLAFPYQYKLNIPYLTPRYIPLGKRHLKGNLRLSEFLFKLSYLKSNIFPNARYEGSQLLIAAHIIETLKVDLTQISPNKLNALHFPEISKSYIAEFLRKDSSLVLKKYEKQAFEILKKVQKN